MTDPNLTHIIIVLDRSGSMESVRDYTISGFNEFIETQRNEIKGRALVTFMQFNYETMCVIDGVPLMEVRALSRDLYAPTGGTALYDAMGMTMTDIGRKLAAMPEDLRPSKVLMLTMTDGEENASRHYTQKKVRDMIEHQRTHYSWQFVFLGANQDAILTAKALDIPTSGAMTYSCDAIGTRQVFRTAAAHTVAYANTEAAVAFSAQDRVDNAPQTP